MDLDGFNAKLFIDEIEKRPSIWDIGSPEYKDRSIKKMCWEELVDIFCNVEPDSDRNISVMKLQKKWKGIRDNFTKESRRRKNKHTEPGKRPYIYFQRLSFLESTVATMDNVSNENDTDEMNLLYADTGLSFSPDTDEQEKRQTTAPSKKIKQDPANVNFPEISTNSFLEISTNSFPETTTTNSLSKRETLEQENPDDGDKLFCLSLHKELRKVPESRRLLTKIEILNVIHRAQTNST